MLYQKKKIRTKVDKTLTWFVSACCKGSKTPANLPREAFFRSIGAKLASYSVVQLVSCREAAFWHLLSGLLRYARNDHEAAVKCLENHPKHRHCEGGTTEAIHSPYW